MPVRAQGPLDLAVACIELRAELGETDPPFLRGEVLQGLEILRADLAASLPDAR